MNPAGTIALALFLTTFGVMLFWYIWVKVFEWELGIWYRHNIQHRQERELDLPSIDLEMGRGSEAASKKSGGEGSKKAGGEGSKKSDGGGSKHGSKAASKKSGRQSGGASRHDSPSAGKA